MPDPDLSDAVQSRVFRMFARIRERGSAAVRRGFFTTCGRLLATAGGKRSIPRCLAPP